MGGKIWSAADGPDRRIEAVPRRVAVSSSPSMNAVGKP
jgi:hypothetical protein